MFGVRHGEGDAELPCDSTYTRSTADSHCTLPAPCTADAGEAQQPGTSDEHHESPGWTEDWRNVLEQEVPDEVEVLEAL